MIFRSTFSSSLSSYIASGFKQPWPPGNRICDLFGENQQLKHWFAAIPRITLIFFVFTALIAKASTTSIIYLSRDIWIHDSSWRNIFEWKQLSSCWIFCPFSHHRLRIVFSWITRNKHAIRFLDLHNWPCRAKEKKFKICSFFFTSIEHFA